MHGIVKALPTIKFTRNLFTTVCTYSVNSRMWLFVQCSVSVARKETLHPKSHFGSLHTFPFYVGKVTKF